MAIKSDHNRSHFYIYFNWLLLKILYMNEHYLRGWGPLDGVEARELFALWQSNFIGYGQLGYFTVIVSGD